jgi:hypothetical protein
MKKGPLLFLLLLGSVFLLESSGVLGLWYSNSDQKINSTRHGNVDHFGSYRLFINFEDMNATHTHTLNNGDVEIKASVKGKANGISTGQLNQVGGHYEIYVYSSGYALGLDISLDRIVTSYGDKNLEVLEDELREDIVNVILNEISAI